MFDGADLGLGGELDAVIRSTVMHGLGLGRADLLHHLPGSAAASEIRLSEPESS